MRLVVSWLRDFVDVAASPEEIAATIGLRGFEVAAIERLPDGDAVIDFEVTANRPDALSVIGLAREVATAFDRPMKMKSLAAVDAPVSSSAATDRVHVTIDDAEGCPRYAAAVADVTPVLSPSWMTTRLAAAGVRPISAIVDITNYVLIELGHPMHAFDLATLAGSAIVVRRAKTGERIKTIDGVDRALDHDMLVIADRDHAQAVAGVMGGAASEVSATTKAVVFESAYFKPASVRRTGKRLGLKTEASARFERGADINAPGLALRRAIALMESIGAGRVSGGPIDRYAVERHPMVLHLRRGRLESVLGVTVPDADVARILHGLGLDVSSAADGWRVLVPTFRVDLLREVDLIEEVARHYGFDRLQATFPVLTAPAPRPDSRIARDRLVRRVFAAAGLGEAVTFGFIDARAAALFEPDAANLVGIANPLSAKFDTLRPSLAPGLVDAVAHNRRHGRHDVALFEIGTRFTPAGETRAAGFAITGTASAHWEGGARPVDFFDAKGIVERLADALDVAVTFEPVAHPFLTPGQSARISAGATPIGLVGRVTPAVVDERGAPKQDDIFIAEIDLDAAAFAARPRSGPVQPLARHPFVVRDLSFFVADTLPAAIIRGTIQSAGAQSLTGVEFFDRYQGKGVPDGRVSLSVHLTFGDADRTLTDAEVQQAVETIVRALAERHGATLRGA